MRRLILASLACLVITGCEVDYPAIPADEPFGEVVSDLAFGMYAADLRAKRPDYYLSDDGTYGETIVEREYSYLFTPKDAGRPPPLTARLVGIESRLEYWDTLLLWSEWTRLRDQYSAISGASPECAVLSDARNTWTRALFGGEVMRRITAEIFRGPDGQSFDAYLVTRISVGSVEAAEGQRRAWTPTDCKTVADGDF